MNKYFKNKKGKVNQERRKTKRKFFTTRSRLVNVFQYSHVLFSPKTQKQQQQK